MTIQSRRGVIIAPVDVRDAQQVFDARLAIESKIAELAAVRATAAQAQELREESDQLDAAGRTRRDYRAFLDHDQQLHMALAKLARNRFLHDALVRVWMVNLRL